MIRPRLDLGTFSVLDWRDNQLHHRTVCWRFGFGRGLISSAILTTRMSEKCGWYALAIPAFHPSVRSSGAIHDKAKMRKNWKKMRKKFKLTRSRKPMRQPRIERGAHRWQRWILPLNHWRLLISPVFETCNYEHQRSPQNANRTWSWRHCWGQRIERRSKGNGN